MEFPHLGNHCNVETCRENDFLPFKCSYCAAKFCKNHYGLKFHNCHFEDNVVDNPTTIKGHVCSHEPCKTRSSLAMTCVKCEKHFCLTHRFHGCWEESLEEIDEKLKLWQKPKDEFKTAKDAVDVEITKKLVKSKNSTMADKVQLMRLKGRATGTKGIPIVDRKYFQIYPPLSSAKKEPQAIFVNIHWTIGRIIDSIADIMNIKNRNNEANSIKLRLFHHSSGSSVCVTMDTLFSDLFNNSSIVEGENLILEYSNDEKIDHCQYK